MTSYKCPKCGAKLEDFREGDEWGYFADEPFRCSGHLIQPVPYPHISPDCALNRTKSCGYFSFEALGIENDGN
ncbi:hypothetical protein L5B97_00270 [Avibacterium sp. 20-15]|uniref:hypothetical protein n=1 Tax=unclassified Avibacterium TaxID=2685287 RepID=UPI0020263666|nr:MULTISPECIES: hypothetical protein [unclassified Avibacterium]MCW9731936.1 hypothetical protein [Avibacterium sp. 20-15]URL04125.1 hypothetical protein L4F93_11350 [Avibacterium sp. 20-132]